MANTDKIRELNDHFRKTLHGGKVVVAAGIAARPDVPLIMEHVRQFIAFDTDNDPHHEHDFGAFKIGGDQVFFKIDYYDPDLQQGSPDPSDPAVTCRVLTVMLAEEY